MDLLPTATAWARAYVVPTLVAGVLLLAVGIGISIANGAAFVATELARVEQVLGEYSRVVFVERPAWRAAAITTIAVTVVTLHVDSNADARIAAYRE